MQIKRQGNFFKGQVLLGLFSFLIVLLLLSMLSANGKQSNKGKMLANKLEQPNSFQAYNMETIDFRKFLDTYAQKGYTILFWSFDDITNNLSESQQMLKRLGSKTMDSIAFRDSYVGVIKDGIFVEEKISSDSLVSIRHDNFLVSGLGFAKKKKKKAAAGIVYIADFTEDKIPVSKAPKRGMNALVYKNDDEFIKETITYNFDFYAEKNPSSPGLKKTFFPTQDKLTIQITGDEFNKIKKKRKEALDLGLLLTYDEDWIPAKVSYQDKEYKAEIRLKGDWTDHLVHKNKWSYKVKLDNGTILGTNKFSVQTAAARNYMGEWMFHQLLKKGDVISLRYSFLNVAVIIEGEGQTQSLYNNIGVMAFEEGFTKYLLENNRRKEGVILKIDESLGWEDFKKGGRNFSNPTLPISAFEMNKILKDSNKYNQFIQAKDMLHSYYLSKKEAPSSIFDYDKFAYWDAVATYTAGIHGHALHNQRFYYNSTTSLLEPVGFDALGYYYAEKPFEVQYSFPEDQAYRNLVLSKLHELMTVDYAGIENLFLQENYMEASDILSSEYPKKSEELKDAMLKRYEKIKSIYSLSHPLDIYLESIDKNSAVLNFRNVTKMDIEVLGINYKKKSLISFLNPIYVKENSFKKDTLAINEGAFNVFFDKAAKTTDRAKFQFISINYRIVGTDKVKSEKIIPYPYDDPSYTKKDVMRMPMEASHFPFMKVEEKTKLVRFVKAAEPWKLAEPLRIEKGYKVVVPPGFEMDIAEGGLIISKSPVYFNGAKESPIKIFSSSGKGGGILVLQTDEKSNLNYTIFDGLKNPSYGKWGVTGAITFYESPVTLQNVNFQNNGCEDALNIVRTNFTMANTYFYNTKSDAFDGDFVTGSISQSFFENLGNDGIDVSGSDISLNHVKVKGASDKAISIGENSSAKIKQVAISDSEIGVNTKDLSTTTIDGLDVKNTRLAFTAFQKKEEFGAGSIVANNVNTLGVDKLFLIEENSSMVLNGKQILTKTKAVKDKMYGNDYGRKSER